MVLRDARYHYVEPVRTLVRAPEKTPRVTWHGFLLTESERQGLNQMLGSAFMDDAICARLVQQRDPALMTAFGLSIETQQWLTEIHAESLEALAEELALLF